MKELIERLMDIGEVSECYDAADALEQQAKQIEELSTALAAKDEALAAMIAYAREENKGLRIADEALSLQPHAGILNKVRADAVREGLAEWEGTTKPIYKFMHEYADRIEKGEA